MSENIQYEMLEGLINSLAKRIDNLDNGIRGISRERNFLYKYGKEFNTLFRAMKLDLNKIYEEFLRHLDAIEEQGLSIEEVRYNIKEKMKKGGN